MRSFTRGAVPTLYEPGLISQQLASGWVHLVLGPGIPIWINQRTF